VLAHANARVTIDWARVALDMGFADQSHMIAECRQFSGLSPQSLADRDWFHPFIERAKSEPRR
jgi:AraC-like DNA-binding protein